MGSAEGKGEEQRKISGFRQMARAWFLKGMGFAIHQKSHAVRYTTDSLMDPYIYRHSVFGNSREKCKGLILVVVYGYCMAL